MKFETREDAVRQWVTEMNYFPLDMLLKACGDDFYEITPYTEEEAEDLENQDLFPMWSYLWQFSDSADERWGESEEGLNTLKKCGFRIYHSEEFGDFIGIDGCGYSFIQEHWTPLYLERGLHWSKED